ncbi:Uncharacterized protein PBTT_03033 [Plasmodiophora brassicae]|uniref:Uncharacterized protein n=1 Tax=Plasmodiophora brassicae TaxID=37360 RepID=A0A0G4J6R6_PLABS|nr:hypothetical protein PBRA_003043 [Plasmodiophora brassicae]
MDPAVLDQAPKGQAYGFKLATSRQLEQAKTTDKVTMQHSPTWRNVWKGFPIVPEASQIESAAPPAECRILLLYANRIQSQIATFDVDGRKKGPIDHGPTSREAGRRRRQTVQRGCDPDSVRFSMVAIVERQDS